MVLIFCKCLNNSLYIDNKIKTNNQVLADCKNNIPAFLILSIKSPSQLYFLDKYNIATLLKHSYSSKVPYRIFLKNF